MFNLITCAFLVSIGWVFVESMHIKLPENGTISDVRTGDAIRTDPQGIAYTSENGFVDTRTSKVGPQSGLPDQLRDREFVNYEAIATRKWYKVDLTYKIKEYSKKLSRAVIKERVAKAFKMWSDASKLTFTEIEFGVAVDVDLTLRFSLERSDGEGGVLGRGEYPPGGIIIMDDAEKWTVESKDGQPLLPALVHEIGHALGLGHSEHTTSIMQFGFDIDEYKPNWRLGHDDIVAIQFLYGKPDHPGPTLEPPQITHKFPCPFEFSAVMSVSNRTYGFMENQFFEILPNGKIIRSMTITSAFPNGPLTVQAAAHDENTGRTFLFNGMMAWRFTNHKLDAGFPKKTQYLVRNAFMMDDYLTGFSLTRFQILDEDTMEDDFEGEKPISEDYPTLKTEGIKSIISFKGDLRYRFYAIYENKVLKSDIDSPELYEEKCVKAQQMQTTEI